MKRRQFIKLSLLASLSLPAMAAQGSTNPARGLNPVALDNLTITKVNQFLRDLPLHALVTSGEWNLSQIFNHAAQSIEFSIMGYPQNKPELFRSTVGPAAFKAFSLWGKMTHGLAEAIPGAPELVMTDADSARERLITALTDFDQFKGQLKPHFAYGELTKDEYVLAHVLHLNNHLEEIQLVQTA